MRAVVASEDASFFGHAGFDWDEIRNAAEQNWKAGRTVRGASTITQQLAKNLWLGTERSYLRKAREALLAVKLERSLSKRRILTLYLDVAEWGNGVFGAEAAARRWFGIERARPLGRPGGHAGGHAARAAPRGARPGAPLAGPARRGASSACSSGTAPCPRPRRRRARAELERLLAAPPALPSDADEEPPEDG